MRCADIRKRVCYAYADVIVSEENAQATLPENGAPDMIVQEAMEMAEAEKFEPSMDGPAKLREPGCKVAEEVLADEDKDEENSQDGAEETERARA